MSTKRTYYAPCALGLEPLLEREVRDAGGNNTRQHRGGVSFLGDTEVGYRVTLWSRVAIRVLEQLAEGRINGPDDLYALARTVSWPMYMSSGQTVAVFAAVSGRVVRHSKYAAQRVKDAVVDQLREETGARPNVDRHTPDVPLKITVREDRATLSRDLAGDSMHRRGWRPVQVRSPLNEALAAGLLQFTEWDRRSPLCDPMCGSATFLIEAAHLAADRAPGLRRSFALERFIDHDTATWTRLRDEAEARWKAGRGQIPPLCGNDQHGGAIAIARDSAQRAEVAEYITLTTGDVGSFRPMPPPAVIVTNPPYGMRLTDDVTASWQRLGSFFKDLGQGDAWVLSGDPELTRAMHLKANSKIPMVNGGIDCRWMRYPLRPRVVRPRSD